MARFDVSVMGLFILDAVGLPVIRIPEGGSVDFIDEIRLTTAGPAGGTAVDCAKLGLRGQVFGAVGDDPQGFLLRHLLETYQLDTAGLQTISQVPTSTSLVCVQPDGQRPALHAREASDLFLLPATSYERAFDATVVHMGGTGLLKEMDGVPTRDFLAQAQSAGCITTFDVVGARPEISPLVHQCLSSIDYFMPSIEEAAALSGLSLAEDIVQYFVTRGVKVCVLTRGAEGALISDGSHTVNIPAFEVAVRDTTGCGDAFSAGFIAGLIQGADWQSAGRLGAACAALVATGVGSDAGLHDLKQARIAMQTLPLKDIN